MDPIATHALAEVVAPALAMLVFGAVPVALVFISKHFKLRHRELELEAQLHGREAEARLRALETRQTAVEAGLHALMGSLGSLVQRAEPEGTAPSLSAPPEREAAQALGPRAAPTRIRG